MTSPQPVRRPARNRSSVKTRGAAVLGGALAFALPLAVQPSAAAGNAPRQPATTADQQQVRLLNGDFAEPQTSGTGPNGGAVYGWTGDVHTYSAEAAHHDGRQAVSLLQDPGNGKAGLMQRL